jgi:hypothetical protein
MILNGIVDWILGEKKNKKEEEIHSCENCHYYCFGSLVRDKEEDKYCHRKIILNKFTGERKIDGRLRSDLNSNGECQFWDSSERRIMREITMQAE